MSISAICSPFSVYRFLYSVFRFLYSVFRFLLPIFCFLFPVLRFLFLIYRCLSHCLFCIFSLWCSNCHVLTIVFFFLYPVSGSFFFSFFLWIMPFQILPFESCLLSFALQPCLYSTYSTLVLVFYFSHCALRVACRVLLVTPYRSPNRVSLHASTGSRCTLPRATGLFVPAVLSHGLGALFLDHNLGYLCTVAPFLRNPNPWFLVTLTLTFSITLTLTFPITLTLTLTLKPDPARSSA